MTPGQCFPSWDGRAHVVARWNDAGQGVALMECRTAEVAQREAARMNDTVRMPRLPRPRLFAVRERFYGPEFGDLAD